VTPATTCVFDAAIRIIKALNGGSCICTPATALA